MRRVFPKQVPLTKGQRKRLRKLEARYKAVWDKYPDGEVSEADAAKLERIEAAAEGLNKQAFGPRDIALAGAFVTIGHDGAVRIERDFVRPEDEPQPKGKAKNNEAVKADGPAPLSEKLVAELTAYRTAALRNELAQHPEIALLALVHRLALEAFLHGYDGSCVEIAAKHAFGRKPCWKADRRA